MSWFKRSKPKPLSELPTVALNAVIVDNENRVLLTRRSDNGLWCLPGGMLEHGETIEAGLKREVFEEIRCRVRLGKLVGVYSAPNVKLTPPARSFLIVVCVFAEITEGVPGTSREVTATGYFNGNDLPPMVPNQSERIQHALHYDKAILL